MKHLKLKGQWNQYCDETLVAVLVVPDFTPFQYFKIFFEFIYRLHQ